MIPHILIVTDKMPEKLGGMANAFVVRIRPKYANDAGLIAHEKEHVRQFWITLGMHGILYLLSKRYRLWSETTAYRVQLSFEADPVVKERKREQFKKWIAEEYRLGMKPEEVDL